MLVGAAACPAIAERSGRSPSVAETRLRLRCAERQSVPQRHRMPERQPAHWHAQWSGKLLAQPLQLAHCPSAARLYLRLLRLIEGCLPCRRQRLRRREFRDRIGLPGGRVGPIEIAGMVIGQVALRRDLIDVAKVGVGDRRRDVRAGLRRCRDDRIGRIWSVK